MSLKGVGLINCTDMGGHHDVCVCMYVCVCVCMCMYVCVCVYGMYHVCMCVYMYVCVCMYVCVYVYACSLAGNWPVSSCYFRPCYVHTYTHTHTHTREATKVAVVEELQTQHGLAIMRLTFDPQEAN